VGTPLPPIRSIAGIAYIWRPLKDLSGILKESRAAFKGKFSRYAVRDKRPLFILFVKKASGPFNSLPP
jgi:hypothetical protein